jgi:putative toxin-antitoxin system antitoxin component (TIGR02293 family)
MMSPLTKPTKLSSPRRAHAQRLVRFKSRGESLGLRADDTPGLIRKIEEGFSFGALLRFEINTGVTLALLGTIIGIPERTLARRRTTGKLAPEESERLFRVSSVFEKATRLFEGDVDAAVTWLTTPKKALGGQQPLLYSRTELGAREVENLLGRIEYGVFS